MNYHAPENIYWLFSSSAQAVAAFIGFLTAGFYFVLDKMDNQVEKDSTLEEINQEIKRSHFYNLKIMCFLTGSSIVFSLAMVYLNGFDFGFKNYLLIVVCVLNILTISWAIKFIINIIDPDNIDKAAQKLINADKDLITEKSLQSRESVSIGDYLDRFVIFEKGFSEYCKRLDLSFFFRDKSKQIPLNFLIRMLSRRGIIDNLTLRNIFELNKIRNLAAHGKIERVDKRMMDILSMLIVKFTPKE